LLEMGTEKEDYVSLTQRISRKTGGIHTALHTSVVKNSEKSTAWMLLRGKAMVRQVEELLAILQDILLAPRLDDQVRFRQMVLESKARLEHAIIPSGHHILDLRLRTAFSEADWVAEQMSGISYLLFLRELEERVEKDWVQVLSALEKIRELLINRHALLLNITVDEKKWLQIQAQVEAFLDSLPYFEPILHSWKPRKSSDFEGLTIPAQVNYVGKGMNLFSHGYRFHGSAHVITRYLRNSWLWEKVRVEGGAYGAFCLFDRLSGVLTLVSYRDPNIFKTLEAFEGAAGFLKGLDLSATELTRAIVGAIGDIDRYQLPDAKGYTSMVRYLSGETEPERQRIREEVLGTTVQDFNSFGAVLEEGAESALVKILGPKSAIEEVAAKKRWGLKVFDVL
ncbi:MAG: peptidase M16, partial [Deltaproteobacteria bacterium]